MITIWQAIILGLLQGFSELFPISSLGHGVIVPRLLGWQINQNASFFLIFLVATHLATATVLFIFLRTEWIKIIKGLFRSLKEREIRESDSHAKLAWLLVIGTIPAGILGLLFEEQLKVFFASAQYASFFLILNGIMLFLAELLRIKKGEKSDEKGSDSRIAKTSWLQAVGVGIAQSIALIPGFSRTGATISGGLLFGLSHEDSLKYSFLLATPIIAAASILKIPELFTVDERQLIIPAFLGAISAAASAFLSVKFLTKYFKTRSLIPFAIYCVAAGGLFSLLFFFFPV